MLWCIRQDHVSRWDVTIAGCHGTAAGTVFTRDGAEGGFAGLANLVPYSEIDGLFARGR